MIVIVLSGGLGNQMFEYAAARATSLRVGTDLVLNTRMGFERDLVYHRVFALDIFNIKYSKHCFLSFDFPFGYVVEKISRKIGRHILAPWYKYLFDNEINIYTKLKTLSSKHVIMKGTWVKQDYFDDFIDCIRNDFTFKGTVTPQMSYYIKEIQNSKIPVIGMGVRIYQEIKDESIRKNGFFYTDAAFYNKAIKYYCDKYGKIKLLIFTQAKEWVLSNVNLNGIDYEFVCTSTCDKDSVNDMIILSKCNHYIIANSSFYFWGVWLNPNEKEVIIPSQWTNSSLKEWKKI